MILIKVTAPMPERLRLSNLIVYFTYFTFTVDGSTNQHNLKWLFFEKNIGCSIDISIHLKTIIKFLNCLISMIGKSVVPEHIIIGCLQVQFTNQSKIIVNLQYKWHYCIDNKTNNFSTWRWTKRYDIENGQEKKLSFLSLYRHHTLFFCYLKKIK